MIPRACRLAVGAALAWSVGLAIGAPELPVLAVVAAAVVLVATVWRPGLGLVAVATLAPAGVLLAPAPARAAELLAWAFLSGWLLTLWRPLAPADTPRAVTTPALLYLATAAASWVGLTIAGAVGVAPAWLPVFLWRIVPADYLIFSTPSPEVTALLQTLAGIGVFLAALTIVRAEPSRGRVLMHAMVASITLLAAATAVQVWREWAGHGFDRWLVDRFVLDLPASRFSVHLKDTNAAGSLYALAGLYAATRARWGAERSRLWAGVVVVLLPAFWVTGSRTAMISAALAAGGLALAWRAREWSPARTRVVAAVVALVVVATAGLAIASRGDDGIGSASRAVGMRWQFTETSVRMFAAAPVLGVGVGRYHGRSAEFMPPALRAIYPNENAHNYFAQEFAELGLVGGALFVWLMYAVFGRAWSAVRGGAPGHRGELIALLAGCAGYLLTCVAGHPLLVPEAALPFWAALGALAAATPADTAAPASHRWVTRVVGLVLGVGLVASTVSYLNATTWPEPSGLTERTTAPDGTAFMWTTRHVVTYGGRTPGFIRLVLRAPDVPASRPFVVETWLGGHVVDRSELPRGRWLVKEIPVRGAERRPARRIDLLVNQAWVVGNENPNAPERPALGVMAAEVRWAGPGAR